MSMRRDEDDDHNIKLNVGGKEFVTRRSTLAKAGRTSMPGAMISHDWEHQKSNAQEYFIDRNPAYFSVLLDFLRTGEIHIPPHMSVKVLYREALYYGLMDRLHMAAWAGSLDGNRLRHAASIRGRDTGDATAIRAAQDGGCCWAHGSMVHVYDWAMEELHPLNLDFHLVNDVGFLNPQRLVICTCASVDKPSHGGMASFNTRTGKLQHRFQVCHQGGQHKNFTAGALASSSSHGQVYASCRGLRPEYGVGIWDQTTGQQADFVYDWPLGDAGKLQWLSESHLLLAATLYPRSDHAHISLLDFREKSSAVLSWTDCHLLDDKVVVDAVAMEDCRTVCVVNQYDNLGFLDMRSMKHVKWCHRNRPRRMVSQSEGQKKRYSKLAACGMQLFSTKNKSVHVFCAPDWVLTSQVENKRGSCGGSISDIAVGGGRLFVLYNEEDVFDVWETPPSLHTSVYREDE